MPERGDIVILTPKGKYQDWIKRVIGLPGDTIALREGQIFLNGKPVSRIPSPIWCCLSTSTIHAMIMISPAP